jgi:hypothetical protein
MAKAAKGSKDKQMAAHLKERKVKRTTGQCPMCHGSVGNGQLHTLVQCATVRRARRPHLAGRSAA